MEMDNSDIIKQNKIPIPVFESCEINTDVYSGESEEKEWKSFLSVQLERYLKRKTIHRFCSNAEKDVIKDVIGNYWNQYKTDILKLQSKGDKVRYSYKCIIVFPYFVAEDETIIPVDFQIGKALSTGCSCNCGSGLDYFECCGLNCEPDVLMNGSF